MKQYQILTIFISLILIIIFISYQNLTVPLADKMCSYLDSYEYPAHRDCWNDNKFLVYSYNIGGGGTAIIYVLTAILLIFLIKLFDSNSQFDSTIKKGFYYALLFIFFCGINHLFDLFTTLYGGNFFIAAAISKILMFIVSCIFLLFFVITLQSYILKLPKYDTFVALTNNIKQQKLENQEVKKELKILADELVKAENHILLIEIAKKINHLSKKLEK